MIIVASSMRVNFFLAARGSARVPDEDARRPVMIRGSVAILAGNNDE